MRRRARAIFTNSSKLIATRKSGTFPIAADFAGARGLKVLEIGCGLGTDGAQFAEAGADYTGVDLTEAAVELARKRFELFDLPGKFQTADAENLDFADESFDLVYSHGVLHHTPETAKAIRKFIACCVPADAPWSCFIIAIRITIASTFRCCGARARNC